MLSIYPACFFKDDDGYSVIFPDLNWLATDGQTEQEAFDMAVDCLAGYLYSAWEDGDEVSPPSSINDISIEDVARKLGSDTNNAFVNLVSIDVAEYSKKHFAKSVRKSLTIPAWLDSMAREKKINFSQVLREALLSKIQS